MRVTMDVSAAVNGRAGLGRYAQSLAVHMSAAHLDALDLFANRTPDAGPPPPLGDVPLRMVRVGYKPWRMAVLLGQMARIGFNRVVRPGDLFHATEHLLPPLRGVPSVLTVHDLIYHIFPEHHKRLNYWFLKLAMPIFVRRADHVIAVSEATKRDLIAHYGAPHEKITVVYEAAGERFAPQPPERIAEARAACDLPGRYLLAVGTIEPRKNYARLVEALAVLRKDDPDLRLAIVGAEGWLTGDFYAALKRSGQNEAVIRPGWVTDRDLPALYAGALAVAQPSLYEGFGLPVLEAMAVGTPVVCGDRSSLPEIAGEAALTVDPEDVGALVAALRRLIGDGDLRAELREKGLKRASQFSWAKAAEETWAVYEKVFEGKRAGLRPAPRKGNISP